MKKPNLKFTRILLIVLGIIVAAIISFHSTTFNLSEVHNLGELNGAKYQVHNVLSALQDQVSQIVFLILT